MDWGKMRDSFLGVKRNEPVKQPVSLITSGAACGLSTQEVRDIFSLLSNKYISGKISLGDVKIVPKTEELVEKIKIFKSSNFYQLLEDFVKEYGMFYSSENFETLRKTICENGLRLADNELDDLIGEENEKQSRQLFKTIMLAESLSSFNDYLGRFVKIYGKQIKLLDDLRFLLAMPKNLDAEEMKERLHDNYINFDSVSRLFPENENALAHFKTMAQKAQLIHFFIELISENNIGMTYGAEHLDSNRLIDLIMDKTSENQSAHDDMFETLIKTIAPEMRPASPRMERNFLYVELYEKIKLLDVYSYLKNFLKKYPPGDDTNERCLSLGNLLQNKGFRVDEVQLHALIFLERHRQGYLELSKLFNAKQVKTLKDAVGLYAEICNKQLKDLASLTTVLHEVGLVPDDERISLINHPFVNENGETYYISFVEWLWMAVQATDGFCYLKKYIYENKIQSFSNRDENISNETLIRMIFYAGKDNEQQCFEKSLESEEFYTLEQIDSMSGYEFENFLKLLFQKMGYQVNRTKLSGDQGADLVVHKFGKSIVVQAKRWGASIGNSAIQEVVASIKHYKADQGMVVTNAEFTSSAIQLADSNHVVLIAREQLRQWIQEYL